MDVSTACIAPSPSPRKNKPGFNFYPGTIHHAIKFPTRKTFTPVEKKCPNIIPLWWLYPYLVPALSIEFQQLKNKMFLKSENSTIVEIDD